MSWQRTEAVSDKRSGVVVRLPDCTTKYTLGVDLFFDDWQEAEEVLQDALGKIREKRKGKERNHLIKEGLFQ